jgi:hypothetical protein
MADNTKKNIAKKFSPHLWIELMSLKESVQQLDHLLANVAKDLIKVTRGNKAAAQRVRVCTIKLERVAKVFRRESVAAEKSGKLKKPKPKLKKKSR